MNRFITTVAGPVYWVCVVVAAIFVLNFLVNYWRTKLKSFSLLNHGVAYNCMLGSIALTLSVCTGFALCAVLVWNMIQGVTAGSSNYTSEAQTEYQQKALSVIPPSKEEMEKAKADLKNRSEVQPHQKALSDFDAKMEAEARKIKLRSLSGTNQTGAEKK